MVRSADHHGLKQPNAFDIPDLNRFESVSVARNQAVSRALAKGPC